jgi:hypothetical protein
MENKMSQTKKPNAETTDFLTAIKEYRQQVAKGAVKTAYAGIIGYLEDLRLHLEKKYPNFYVSSSVQPGCMDNSYFYFSPKTLKQQKLKIVILFVHDSFRFEVWLAGYNKTVQEKYWKKFKDTGFSKYRMPSTLNGADSIVEHTLVDNADFSNLQALRKQIEDGTLRFIEDIEGLLSKP